MIGTVYRIQPEQIPELTTPNPALMEYANASYELYCGMWDGECACIMGLIPRAFLSSSAYLWLHVISTNHPLPFARHARRFVANALARYSSLVGHCSTPSAQRWLATLGANFTPLSPSLLQFEIKSWTRQA